MVVIANRSPIFVLIGLYTQNTHLYWVLKNHHNNCFSGYLRRISQVFILIYSIKPYCCHFLSLNRAFFCKTLSLLISLVRPTSSNRFFNSSLAYYIISLLKKETGQSINFLEEAKNYYNNERLKLLQTTSENLGWKQFLECRDEYFPGLETIQPCH